MSVLRLGILGTAGICEAVVPALLANPSVSVRAVASRSREKAQALATRYGIPDAYEGYESLLDASLLDAVYIPLPNSLHAQWTLRALDAGLHVLCEKPLTRTVTEARRVRDAAWERHRVVMEAFMYRHHPLYDELATKIHEGAIGKIRSIHGHFSFFLDEPGSIVERADLGGGALLDVGCYVVNAARLLLQEEPERVAALARMDGVDRGFAGVLFCPSGTLVTLHAAIDGAERHRLEIHGETGHLVCEQPWHLNHHTQAASVSYFLERHGEARQEFTVAGDDPYNLEVEAFVQACQGGNPPRWNVEDSVKTMRVLEALSRAAQAGRVVELSSI